MLIGLCGGICAGKNAVADYLVEHQGFVRLKLSQPALNGSSHQMSFNNADSNLNLARDQLELQELSFDTVDLLLDHVTRHWQKHWVMTNISNEFVLEKLLQRPFVLLVSVDAPIWLRWKRFMKRCEDSGQACPILEEFVIQNDDHLYNQTHGLAWLIDKAEVRIVNQTPSLMKLHETLDTLDLANPQRLRPTWDQYFMQLASLAAQRSNCMKRRVGCVIVQGKRVISTGYNGTPRNLKNCNEGGCPRCNSGVGAGISLTTCLCIHAEENALLEAGRERIREGSILYCDLCPCLTCSIKITQMGISEVVYSKSYGMDQEAAAVFAHGGVVLRQFTTVSSSTRYKKFRALNPMSQGQGSFALNNAGA